MNIQIFGRRDCAETRKAERWFKERRIPFQFIDLKEKGFSPKELETVARPIGMENLLDRESKRFKEKGLAFMSPSRVSQVLLEIPCWSRPRWCGTAPRPPWASSPKSGRPGTRRDKASSRAVPLLLQARSRHFSSASEVIPRNRRSGLPTLGCHIGNRQSGSEVPGSGHDPSWPGKVR